MESQQNVVPFPTEEKMRRTLARSRIVEAKRLVEQAQNILDRAARNLCPIIGGAPKHRRVSALSDRCRAMWYDLDRYERTGHYAIEGEIDARAEVER